jgi:hypothetical protein
MVTTRTKVVHYIVALAFMVVSKRIISNDETLNMLRLFEGRMTLI